MQIELAVEDLQEYASHRSIGGNLDQAVPPFQVGKAGGSEDGLERVGCQQRSRQLALGWQGRVA